MPILCVCVFVLLAALVLAPTYRILDLGLPPGAEKAEAVAINNRGEVLLSVKKTIAVPWFSSRGEKGVSQDSVCRGFLWRAGQFFTMRLADESPTLDPPDVQPVAFNDRSVAVGWSGSGMPLFMTGLTESKPFLWRGDKVEDLRTDGPGQANDINDLGDVVGDAGHGAFARLRGKIVMLPEASHVEPRDPNSEMNDVNESRGIAINDRRLILMDSTYGGKHGDTGLPRRPFLVDGARTPLRMRPVPLPKGFVEGHGVALNDRGTVFAFATRRGDSDVIPFLVRDGRIVRLPFVGAMNNRDEIVGGSPPSVWRRGRATPLPSFPGWELQTAIGINDHGAICGNGLHDGETRAYVLVPR